MTTEMLKSENELIGELSFIIKQKRLFPTKRNSPVYVSTKVRKECMVGINQNKFAAEGRVWKIKWTNLGGGVWEATEEKL